MYSIWRRLKVRFVKANLNESSLQSLEPFGIFSLKAGWPKRENFEQINISQFPKLGVGSQERSLVYKSSVGLKVILISHPWLKNSRGSRPVNKIQTHLHWSINTLEIMQRLREFTRVSPHHSTRHRESEEVGDPPSRLTRLVGLCKLSASIFAWSWAVFQAGAVPDNV